MAGVAQARGHVSFTLGLILDTRRPRRRAPYATAALYSGVQYSPVKVCGRSYADALDGPTHFPSLVGMDRHSPREDD